MKFGWIPDLPDARDYTRSHEKVKAILEQEKKAPKRTDLREFCPPIEDQGEIGSCTANAAAGIVGYYQMRTLNACNPVSRLFIYKATRNLMKLTGDAGASIRTTMGALALFGVPPEKYWEYGVSEFDKEPPAFCYSFAQNYQALVYYRLDEEKKSWEQILQGIKQGLAGGIPAMFGFTVYSSIRGAKDGRIPFPSKNESVLGGHAVVAVGYDDGMKIGNSVGAFIIRNSWGEAWGEKGYGYLPYDYLLKGLAQDWWSLAKAEWVSVKEFGV